MHRLHASLHSYITTCSHIETEVCCVDKKMAALHQVEYCEHAPRAVLENPHALHYMLTRDSETGSFLDYEAHFGKGSQQDHRSFKLTQREMETLRDAWRAPANTM